MIITVIVVGIAFSVLQLVQKEITKIKKNYEKEIEISLLEQLIWRDMNNCQKTIIKGNEYLVCITEIDSIIYSFKKDFILRNKDTLRVKTEIVHSYFNDTIVNYGEIDAIEISLEKEIKDFQLFIFKKNDITYTRNSKR